MKTMKILKLWPSLHWRGSAELQPVARIPPRQWCVHFLGRPTRHTWLCSLRSAPVDMTSWWRCCKECTFDTDVAGGAELRHGQPEEWLPTETVKCSWRWLGRRSPEPDTCNTDILLGRIPTAGVLDNASVVHCTKSQVHNCHTASTAGLCGKYLHSGTIG
jgi:hypothetical protein